MVDKISREQRSRIMSAIRSKNTIPEVVLRRALWAKGYRFRIQYSKEKIDIAFPKKKIAIFVDGCFWHSCPIHSHIPQSNVNYWVPKLKKNLERDKEKSERLKNNGWKVLRVWEHEIADIDKVVGAIEEQFVL
jgi:DNA mismatch endonuclease (patch repair protein)